MADEETPTPTEEAPEKPGEDFKYIVRIAATDLDGNKPVRLALTRIRGVGDRVATQVVDTAGVPRTEKIGNLSDAEIAKLAEAVDGLTDALPIWMRNRRQDIQSGEDVHLLTTELDQSRREDLNRLKKIRSYRGLRHEHGQKVRGQRTRANGRSGLAMGVSRKKEGTQ